MGALLRTFFYSCNLQLSFAPQKSTTIEYTAHTDAIDGKDDGKHNHCIRISSACGCVMQPCHGCATSKYVKEPQEYIRIPISMRHYANRQLHFNKVPNYGGDTKENACVISTLRCHYLAIGCAIGCTYSRQQQIKKPSLLQLEDPSRYPLSIYPLYLELS